MQKQVGELARAWSEVVFAFEEIGGLCKGEVGIADFARAWRGAVACGVVDLRLTSCLIFCIADGLSAMAYASLGHAIRGRDASKSEYRL